MYVCVRMRVCVCMFVLYYWTRGKWNTPVINIPIKQVVFTNLTGILGGVYVHLNSSPYLYFLHFRSNTCLLEFTVSSESLEK